jgi:hypothetical protein
VKPTRLITASESVALIASTWGDLASVSDPTLPRPKIIVSILLFYGAMGLIASFGRGAARVASAASVVMLLTTLVVGPGGRHIIGLLTGATKLTQSDSGGTTNG